MTTLFRPSPILRLSGRPQQPSILMSFPAAARRPSSSSSSSSSLLSSSSSSSSSMAASRAVPGLGAADIAAAATAALDRYSAADLKRNGGGVAIIWFRNDLRLLDNEVLIRAWGSSEAVLPVYCVDPRLFGKTHYFGFPKTGALRAQFLIECLVDLRDNLQKRGLNLLIQQGKPEDILPNIAKTFGAHTVYAHKETCSEELLVEKRVRARLQQVKKAKNGAPTKLQLIWGSTMYHIDDLPFNVGSLPDVYTQFRKSVEYKCKVRSCYKLPTALGPLPGTGVDEVGGWGSIPSLEQLGFEGITEKSERGLQFSGGESSALGRLREYFWTKDLIKIYKETRNGMLGADYSTKFSPWLAFGCISPRYIYEEAKRYERERIANDSTYWVLFELIWRDYFRFISKKYGNSIFHSGGPRNVAQSWSQDKVLFEAWRDGRTGYPLIDANMKELSATGFMSNRGRQIVCSFLVRDMGVDWRMGAEWFETCLLDYDPSSNYGNWTYGAGVGNDPREDRYFSIPKQAQTYDPDGDYVAYWLPELKGVPKGKRHNPGMSYIGPIVPLKFGSYTPKQGGPGPNKGKPFNPRRR